MEGKRRLRPQSKGALRLSLILASMAMLLQALAGCVPGGASPNVTVFGLDNDGVDQTSRMLNGSFVKSRKVGLARAVIGIQMLKKDGTFVSSCTGVLIRPDVVLTAAHCFDPHLVWGVDWMRTVQTDDLETFRKDDSRARLIIHTVSHPSYNSRATTVNGAFVPSYDHDLALAFLDRAYESDGSLVRIANAQEGLSPGDRLVSFGYGFAKELVPHVYGGPRNFKLQTGVFTVSSRWTNDRVFMELDPQLSLCQGDSGGPAFLKAQGKSVILVAVNSASNGMPVPGDGNRRFCRGEAVMQPVAPERWWIEQKLKETGR